MLVHEILSEGLIAVPPKMAEHIDFLLTFHVLWYIRDKFRGREEQFPEQYKAFKELVAKFGEVLPKESYDNSFVIPIPMNLQDMPEQYKHFKKTETQILFSLNWDNSDNLGSWNPKHKSISIFPNSIAYFKTFPSHRNHPEDLEIALNTMKETIIHELRHMVQMLLIKHPDQNKVKTQYNTHGTDYWTSPIEFDPMIGSCIEEFMKMWNMFDKNKPPLKKSIKQFVGALPSKFGSFPTPSFFTELKKNAPERYKIAVKKFILELEKRLT